MLQAYRPYRNDAPLQVPYPQPQVPPAQQQQQTPNSRVYHVRRGMENDPQAQGDPERVIVVIDDDTVRLFVRHVYMFAIFFIIISSVIWLVISGTHFPFYKRVPVPCIVWVLLAFIFLTIMSCCPPTRYTFPCNWLMTISVVFFIILAGCCQMHIFPWPPMMCGLCLAAAIVIALHICGAFCPQRFLPGGVCAACLMIVLMILMVAFFIVMMFVSDPLWVLVFIVLLFLLTILVMPFHAQYVNGRLQIVPIYETLPCALSIYIDYVVIFVCLAYFYLYYQFKQGNWK